jgi:hypothetical protein
MLTTFSSVNEASLRRHCRIYGISSRIPTRVPGPRESIKDAPPGFVGLYFKHFSKANLRVPLSRFLVRVLDYHALHIAQCPPLFILRVTHFELACRAHGARPTLRLFRQFYRLNRTGDWFSLDQRPAPAPKYLSWVPTNLRDWKNEFFWISDRIVGGPMHWREKGEKMNPDDPAKDQFDRTLCDKLTASPMRLVELPEHVLIMFGYSRNYISRFMEPIILLNGKGMYWLVAKYALVRLSCSNVSFLLLFCRNVAPGFHEAGQIYDS